MGLFREVILSCYSHGAENVGEVIDALNKILSWDLLFYGDETEIKSLFPNECAKLDAQREAYNKYMRDMVEEKEDF